MISDYSYTADNIGSSERIPAKSSKKIEKGLKRLLVIAAVIFAVELIWLLGISPFIPFSTIEVRGFEGLRRAEILKLAGIEETSSFMSTNAGLVQERLSGNILVESAKVTKRFPDKLLISLIGRKAAAVTLSGIDGKQVPLYIDTHGVFFKTGNNLAEMDGLVIISGLDNPQLNMRLPDSLVPLMENIAWLSAGSPELLSAISEIRIEQKAWDGYDLVLYPVHSSIRVRVENNITEDVLRYMLLMLSVFEADSESPEEIDFRSGMGSYKIKEKS